MHCQEKTTLFEIFREIFFGFALLTQLSALSTDKQHILGLDPLPFALLYIQDQIIFQYIVLGRIAQLFRGPVNCCRFAFQLDKGPYRGFVHLNQQALRPCMPPWQDIRCPEFLIAEPSAHAQPFKYPLHRRPVRKVRFDLLAHLVPPTRRGPQVPDRKLLWWRLKGEQSPRSRLASSAFF